MDKPKAIHMMKWGPTTECGRVFYRPDPNRVLYPTVRNSMSGVTCKACLRAMERRLVAEAANG